MTSARIHPVTPLPVNTPPPDGSPPATIGMGEIGVARDGGMLRTFLGSCVGLALHDRRRRIAGGLAAGVRR